VGVTPLDSQPPGRALVRAVQGRDPQAAGLLLASYGATLRGFLWEVLGDREAVEDVLQQTLLQAWRRGADYDPARSSLSTWLLVIARTRALDHLRQRVPEPFDPADVIVALDRQSDDAMDELLERWRVAALLAALPVEESRLLGLRFQLGLTQSEIAHRTGIPLGTVKMRMVQALRRLRQLLDDEEAAGA
jgi:RNA polymerase sigma-70 factor, ECF subfamily